MKKSAQRYPHSSLGFTLIELMVAIAIVAILSMIGLVVFNYAQGGGRDAKRKSDLQAIAQALKANRTPGEVKYQQITGDDFAGKLIPTDPRTNHGANPQKYCIYEKSSTAGQTLSFSETGALTPPTPPTLWGADADACPDSGDVTPISGIRITDSTGSLPSTADVVSWMLCARLETGDPANDKPYCVGSDL